MQGIKGILTFVLSVLLVSSCGEYHRVKESNDPELKYAKALEYFQNKEYDKSEFLLNDIIPEYRGTSKYENILYHLVFSMYYQEFYGTAAHYFKLFLSTFPQSTHYEECMYLSAYCYYLVSPEVRLEQSNTDKAIQGFLKFVKLYPDSDKIKKINTYLDVCRDKLTQKSYLSARLYYDREKYKSAIVALSNSLNDYPESSYREQVKYLLLQSHYQFALNSISEKQQERYEQANQNVDSFLEEFPDSQYKQKVAEINQKIKSFLKI